jgi:hypothetical protein
MFRRWRGYWAHSRFTVFTGVLLRRLPVRVLWTDVSAEEARASREVAPGEILGK